MFKVFNIKFLQLLESQRTNTEMIELTKLMQSCYTCLNPKFDLESSDYLCNFVSTKKEHLDILLSFKNE